MSAALQDTGVGAHETDRIAAIEALGPRIAMRGAACDSADMFVQENYLDLQKIGAFTAYIPAQLGGGGASYEETADMLRRLAHHCGSTALALAMHTHLIAALVFRWQRDPQAVEGFLRRVVNENLVLVSTGASDWLKGQGTAERVDGGWRVSGRKIFGSSAPMGDFLVTSAVWNDPDAGPTVLHFPLAMKQDGIKVLDTWHTMAMRGTGSHDVTIDNVFVPEAAVAARRPQGNWHMALHLATKVAFPLVYSVYVGIAEAARDIAVAQARKRTADDLLCCLVGEMEDDLATAQLARNHIVSLGAAADPGPETTNRVMIGRMIAGQAAMRTVSKAMDVVGGGALYTDLGLERRFRDIQGARYHPLQEKAQQRFAGRAALGLPIDG
ncbi:MAG: acyl-CoA dehydrogenase family protein [Acetobacteraceae bacterium]|nr:acyl-CoA dehydrogenase family protein [Pseudomonadota bacterium]